MMFLKHILKIGSTMKYVRNYSKRRLCKRKILLDARRIQEANKLELKVELGKSRTRPDEKICLEDYETITPVTGVPLEYYCRKLYIVERGKHVMQQGTNNTKTWELKFDHQEKWANPLIGYASTGDGHSAFSLYFHTKEEAIEYAERQGYCSWTTVGKESSRAKFKPKSYRQNFVNRRTRISTK